MNINAALRRRQLGFKGRLEIDFAVDQFRLEDTLKLPNPFDELDQERVRGPLACTRLNHDTIAIANEDGFVSLIGTKNLKYKTQWLAHENAIFDIKTLPDRRRIMTASGDSTIRIWDIEQKRETQQLTPHHSSIKSISIYDSNTFASGSRDGTIKIYDMRQRLPTVIIIRDAHRNTVIRKSNPRLGTKTDPISCVTNVLFDTYYPRIYSSGANDAKLKLWDLRKPSDINKPRRTREGHILINQPYKEVHHPTRGLHCGYAHILLASGRLYAACSDNKIYCYEKFDSNAEPIKFSGYKYDTYLKIAVMEDRFLFSGSKGGGAVLWSLGKSSKQQPDDTKQPIGQLKPDTAEFDTNAIETDWESLSVFSMRDDGLVAKWTIM